MLLSTVSVLVVVQPSSEVPEGLTRISLYNGYWVFPRGEERPGRAADHSPPSSAEVLEE
jgi:hypothetical protein